MEERNLIPPVDPSGRGCLGTSLILGGAFAVLMVLVMILKMFVMN